jgi:hypothetical protein
MIKATMQVGQFPQGVNKGMIAILFKAGEKENMGNWCLINYPFECGLQDFN